MTPVRVVPYAPDLPRWPAWQSLKVAVMADLHACRPWTYLHIIRGLVEQVNALSPDLILLPGDFAGHCAFSFPIPPQKTAHELSGLRAPLGVFAVSGNHDWKDDMPARKGRKSRTIWHDALEGAGIPVLANQNVILTHRDTQFALAGIESQRAYGRKKQVGRGAHDVEKALDGIPADMFTLLVAHEPDIFEELDRPVDLTISGHTHGGQIRLFGRPWVVPSDYGTRLAYGLHQRGDKALVVSGGIGYSGLPLRIDVPPELNLVTLS
ncbi:MAG: metallophosphoesterase [Paracoccaceae bacterium]